MQGLVAQVTTDSQQNWRDAPVESIVSCKMGVFSKCFYWLAQPAEYDWGPPPSTLLAFICADSLRKLLFLPCARARVCPCVRAFVCPSVSVCLSVRPSVRPSACPPVLFGRLEIFLGGFGAGRGRHTVLTHSNCTTVAGMSA